MDLDKLAKIEPPTDEQAVEQDLERWLDGGHPVMHRPPWAITDNNSADWAIQRLAECRARVQEYRDTIALWQNALDRIDAAGDWFEDRLKEWAVANRTPQRKSFPLAHGTVGTRSSQQRIEVVDEPAAIAWAKVAAPAAVKSTERFLKSEVGGAASIVQCVMALRATDKATGEYELIAVDVAPLDPARLAKLQTKLGDGFVVEPVFEQYVLDPTGAQVPGLTVKPAEVTASVTPLGL